MASSKYLHCSINLSCIIYWAVLGKSWSCSRCVLGRTQQFLGCVQVSTMLHCLCLLQSWLSILAEPTEKLTAQPPTAWGNTCHAQFGKQRQADCTCKGWVAGGSESLVCSPAVCAICGLQAREPLERLKVKEKREKIDSECSGQSCRQRQNCLSIFFLFCFFLQCDPLPVLSLKFIL